MPNHPILVTIPEACRLVGLGRTRLYDLLRERQIEAVKIGKRTLVKYSSLQALAGEQAAV